MEGVSSVRYNTYIFSSTLPSANQNTPYWAYANEAQLFILLYHHFFCCRFTGLGRCAGVWPLHSSTTSCFTQRRQIFQTACECWCLDHQLITTSMGGTTCRLWRCCRSDEETRVFIVPVTGQWVSNEMIYIFPWSKPWFWFKFLKMKSYFRFSHNAFLGPYNYFSVHLNSKHWNKKCERLISKLSKLACKPTSHKRGAVIKNITWFEFSSRVYHTLKTYITCKYLLVFWQITFFLQKMFVAAKCNFIFCSLVLFFSLFQFLLFVCIWFFFLNRNIIFLIFFFFFWYFFVNSIFSM